MTQTLKALGIDALIDSLPAEERIALALEILPSMKGGPGMSAVKSAMTDPVVASLPPAGLLVAWYAALPEADQYQVAVEIHHRFKEAWGDLPKQTLDEVADELLTDDAGEDAHAQR